MCKVSLKNVEIAVMGLGYVGLPLAVEFGKAQLMVTMLNKIASMNFAKA